MLNCNEFGGYWEGDHSQGNASNERALMSDMRFALLLVLLLVLFVLLLVLPASALHQLMPTLAKPVSDLTAGEAFALLMALVIFHKS